MCVRERERGRERESDGLDTINTSSPSLPQACVESALCAVVHEFQQTVSPYLVSLVQQVQTTDATADFAAIRLKEAGK